MSGQQLPPEIASQNKGPTILAICCTLTAVATIFVSARLYVRAKILSRVGLDDWLIIISMICGYIMLGLTIAAVRAGNGRHFAVLTNEQRSGAILYTIAGFCPGIFSFAIPKLAVVALLTKITNPSQAHKTFLWCMTSGCFVILFGCVIILFAQCQPSRSQWDFTIPRKCWSPWVLVYYAIAAGTLSAAVDLYLAVYPAVVLYNLRMNVKKKIALSAALGLGSIATAVAIYKSTRLPALASNDFTYNTSDITVWTSIEGNSIIIAACIPTLQPLFERLFGRGIFGSTGYGQRHGGYKSHEGDKVVELSTIGGRSHGTSKSSKKHRKMGLADTTIGGQDSQESILGSGAQQPNQHAHYLDENNGILRTQHLTVVANKDPDYR